jgi:hypothetical protein
MDIGAVFFNLSFVYKKSPPDACLAGVIFKYFSYQAPRVSRQYVETGEIRTPASSADLASASETLP